MAEQIRLPKLGESMKEGLVLKVLVRPGDKVKAGDSVFEVETNKATFELESPADGFVKKILVSEDQTVPVHTAMMLIGAEDEQITQGYIDSLKAGAGSLPSAKTGPEPAAEDKDISRLLGGVILKQARGFGEKIALSERQVSAGAAALRSKLHIPCFYLNTKADVTRLCELQTELNEAQDARILLDDLIIKAVGLGLKSFPVMRGQLGKDSILLAEKIDVSLAVEGFDGPIRVIIKDADSKRVSEIADSREKLVSRAKTSGLSDKDRQGGCITVSNLGKFGINIFIPIVVPGQCSILGVGKVADSYVPVGKAIEVRKLLNLTLAVDHKIAGGAEAAQFLDFVKKMLENANDLV